MKTKPNNIYSNSVFRDVFYRSTYDEHIRLKRLQNSTKGRRNFWGE